MGILPVMSARVFVSPACDGRVVFPPSGGIGGSCRCGAGGLFRAVAGVGVGFFRVLLNFKRIPRSLSVSWSEGACRASVKDNADIRMAAPSKTAKRFGFSGFIIFLRLNYFHKAAVKMISRALDCEIEDHRLVGHAGFLQDGDMCLLLFRIVCELRRAVCVLPPPVLQLVLFGSAQFAPRPLGQETGRRQ